MPPPHPRHNGGMLLGQELPQTPRALIYAQIDRVLIARAKGQGGGETLKGLMTMLAPWKDSDWYADLRSITESEPLQDELIWSILEAVVRMLHRHDLWAKAPERVESGKELAQAI